MSLNSEFRALVLEAQNKCKKKQVEKQLKHCLILTLEALPWRQKKMLSVRISFKFIQTHHIYIHMDYNTIIYKITCRLRCNFHTFNQTLSSHSRRCSFQTLSCMSYFRAAQTSGHWNHDRSSIMMAEAVRQLVQSRQRVLDDLEDLEPHRDRFFDLLQHVHPGFVRIVFSLTHCSCLLLLVCCASYYVCLLFLFLIALRFNFYGKDEITSFSRQYQVSPYNTHRLDKRSQFLAIQLYMPNFCGRTNIERTGDLHEAMLLKLHEDGSFDGDLILAYKSFVNDVMLLQGSKLIANNWHDYKLKVSDLTSLNDFIAPLLGILFFELCSFELWFFNTHTHINKKV